jgi:hypothetical protein
MSAVIQAIIATAGSGGPSGPPPPVALDAGFFGDDTNRGLAGQNGWWVVNGGTYNYSAFSGNLAWNTFAYKDGSYTGHTYDFTNGDYMISPSLSVSGTWTSNTISLNYWFYPTSNNIQLLSELGQQQINAGFHYSMLEINGTGNVKARFWDGTPITSGNTVNLNDWNHIYFAEDSQGGHTFELNGIPTTGNPVYTRTKDTYEYFAIGGYDGSNMGAAGGFVGKIGWLEIHDYVVSSNYFNTKSKFVDPQLLLNLDVANPSSYSGTGTTWNSIGNAVQATLVDGPTYYNTGGVKAIAFTGGSYATVPADVWFDQDFTIVAWVNVSSYANWSRIIDFGNGADVNSVLLAVTQSTSGEPAVSTSEIGNVVATGTTLPLNTWTHIVGRLTTNSTLSIWVNGVNVGSANYGAHLPANVTRNNCYIGKSNWGDAGLEGMIGELRIYRGAFSDAKVYDDYYDTRSKYNPPTLALNLEATPSYLDSTSSPTTWTDSVGNVPFTLYGGVGYNSGNGGYLTFQASSSRYAASTTGPALTQWAVEVWHYWNGQNVGSNPCILSDQFVSTINYALGTLDSGALQTGHFNGGWHTTAPYTLPASNAWYHIVGTYNGQDVKLYVNGVCVATTHDPGITPQKGGAGINLMKRWDNPDFWGGRLSSVRIYNGELGAAQVKLNFDATKSQFGL